MGQDMDKDIALNNDGSSGHGGSNIISSLSFYSDKSATHPSPVTTVGTAYMVGCVTFNGYLSTFHGDSKECVCVAFYGDLSASHPAANIHVSVAVDHDLAIRHLLTEPLHLADITIHHDLGFTCGYSCLSCK